jgi:hypothetical protein
MTDTSQYPIPLSKAVPSKMQYGLNPSAPTSRSYRTSIAPQNGSTFSPQSQVILEIPTGRGKNMYLDQSQCYYKFSVQVSTTAASSVGGAGVYVDNSANSFIAQQYVYNGGNQLEFINQYGQLANYLIDNTMSKSQKAGMAGMIGANSYTNLACVATNAAVSYGGSASTSIINQIEGDRSGMSLAGTTTIGTSPCYTFTLPILSGIIGANSSKMLPLSALKAPLRIELFLAAADDALYSGTSGAGCTYQIVNFELITTTVEIDSEMPLQDPQRPIYISTSSYRQANASLASTQASEWTTILPFKFTSMNSLYARFRNMASSVQGANSTAGYRLSSSINPNISNFYLRIGQSLVPNKPVYLMNGYLVGSGAEGLAEIQKSFHSLSSITGEPAYSAKEYNVSATTYSNGQWLLANVPGSKAAGNIDTFANAFSIGLELQSFANVSDTILCGVNTQNTQIFFTAVIASGLTAGGTNSYSYSVDFFCGYDMTLIIQDGIMTTVL